MEEKSIFAAMSSAKDKKLLAPNLLFITLFFICFCFVLFCFLFCFVFVLLLFVESATNTDDYVLLDSVVFDYFRGNFEYSTMTMTVIYF